MVWISIILDFRKLTPFPQVPLLTCFFCSCHGLLSCYFHFLIFFAPTPTWSASVCKSTCWSLAKAEVYPGSLSVRRTQPMPRVLTPSAPSLVLGKPPCGLFLWREEGMALSCLSPIHAGPLRVTLTSSSPSSTWKQNNSQGFWNLLPPSLLKGGRGQGLEWEQMLCFKICPIFSSSPPQFSPIPHTLLFLPFSKRKLLYTSPIVGWNREAHWGRRAPDVLCVWVRRHHSSYAWRIPGTILGNGIFSINGRWHYHINKEFLSIQVLQVLQGLI